LNLLKQKGFYNSLLAFGFENCSPKQLYTIQSSVSNPKCNNFRKLYSKQVFENWGKMLSHHFLLFSFYVYLNSILPPTILFSWILKTKTLTPITVMFPRKQGVKKKENQTYQRTSFWDKRWKEWEKHLGRCRWDGEVWNEPPNLAWTLFSNRGRWNQWRKWSYWGCSPPQRRQLFRRLWRVAAGGSLDWSARSGVRWNV